MPTLVPKAILIPIGLVACLASAACLAGEGRLEINQTCAVNGGCFAGDDPGFPVQIETQGSYVLTSNLDVTVAADPANTTAIAVNEDHVVVDLNGFMILGPAVCSNIPVTSCSNQGSGDGIDGRFFTTVKNGSVRGMGGNGMFVGDGSLVAGVSFFSNGGSGLLGSERVTFVDVVSDRNRGRGIDTNSDSVLRNVRVSGNGQAGISLGGSGVLTNSTASGNATEGIFAANGSTVEASTARGNGQAGILLRDSHAIGNTLFGNGGFGIECNAGGVSAIRGNMFNGNNGTGAEFNADCTPVADNVCSGDAC